MPEQSVRNAHDELLRHMPPGASHDAAHCPFCDGASLTAKEVAGVADERTFTEAEHFALLTDAVQRETSSLTAEKSQLETTVSELQARVDVLEAEKAAETAAKDQAVSEFEAFKAEIAEKAAVEARKADRVARVKAAAELPDTYFTDDRIQRWAEMADEQFEALVADLAEVAAAAPASSGDGKTVTETAAFKGGESPSTPTGSVLGQYFAARGLAPAQKN
jgi:hypothetical protein